MKIIKAMRAKYKPPPKEEIVDTTTGYNFTITRTCGHEETVTLYGHQTRRNEQRRRARVEMCEKCKPGSP